MHNRHSPYVRMIGQRSNIPLGLLKEDPPLTPPYEGSSALSPKDVPENVHPLQGPCLVPALKIYSLFTST